MVRKKREERLEARDRYGPGACIRKVLTYSVCLRVQKMSRMSQILRRLVFLGGKELLGIDVSG